MTITTGSPTASDCYVTPACLEAALDQLRGTASVYLKQWLVIKQMGFGAGRPVLEVTTTNMDPALQELFGAGLADDDFYWPFAATTARLTVKAHAGRSIVQTHFKHWVDKSGKVDPSEFLDVQQPVKNGSIYIGPTAVYPKGLGFGVDGFAEGEGEVVAVPLVAWAVWYGRRVAIPSAERQHPDRWLVAHVLEHMGIDPDERQLIFTDTPLTVSVQPQAMSDADLATVCMQQISGADVKRPVQQVTRVAYDKRVRVLGIGAGAVAAEHPKDAVDGLLASGERTILLYGPPRTGKTHLIDALVPRDDPSRVTVQVHDGWGYDRLVEGLMPNEAGGWEWIDGPLKQAIEQQKRYIVLEEVSRTDFAQAIGELFSLLETGYRGPQNALPLRSGSTLWIPEDTVFLMTMNDQDRSTEEVDDALLGRVAAVECRPSRADLLCMLQAAGVGSSTTDHLLELFDFILDVYPLGHGYFVGLRGDVSDVEVVRYFNYRIRPVLQKFLGQRNHDSLVSVEQKVIELFPHYSV